MIKLTAIHKRYMVGIKPIEVLRGLDLQVERGEWLALLGASGSGKTTLLNIIGALEKPDSGGIDINGINHRRMTAREAATFRRRSLGFIFQAYYMLPELSVLENVALPARLDGKWGRKVRDNAESLLRDVGLGERMEHKAVELSGGEQQRAAIARAMINDPELILADEPTGNLDSKTGAGILEIFKDLHDSESGKTLIMVTHDADVAAMADRTVHMKDGKVVGADRACEKSETQHGE